MAQTNDPVTATDVIGSTTCERLAQRLLSLPVEFPFTGHGTYSGTVTGYHAVDNHGFAILHEVTFTDNDKHEYSFDQILEGHRRYLDSRSPTIPPEPIRIPDPAQLPSHSTPTPPYRTPLPVPISKSLALPASFRDYPLRIPLPDGDTVQAHIAEHTIHIDGSHQWRLQLPDTHPTPEPLWIDTSKLHDLIRSAKSDSRINPPARASPTLHPLTNFSPPIDGISWTSTHPLVGLSVTIYLSSSPRPTASRRQKRQLFSASIEAVQLPRGPGQPQYWGRLHHDQSQSIIFTSSSTLAEASYASDIQCRLTNRQRRSSFALSTPPPTTNSETPLPDFSIQRDLWLARARSFTDSLPPGGFDLFKAGIRLAGPKVPRAALPIYRRGLGLLAKALTANPSDDALWKLLLLYDGLTLGPYAKPESFADAIRRRVGLFLSGDWPSLLQTQLHFRDPSFSQPPSPTSDDILLRRGASAQTSFNRHHSIGAASAALRSPAPTPKSNPRAHTEAFQKLNPQVGSPAPTIPADPSSSPIPNAPLPQHDPLRRPLRPPDDRPPPIVFTTTQVISKVRRTNTASAGGLTGTTYKIMRCWFSDHDVISDDLTSILNLIASGDVPPTIVPLLLAGRGVAVPKDDEGGLRPIVIGHVLLRLIGSLALSELADDVRNFFLKPVPLQFGVGVASGCELMAAAISAHLERNPSHIDISCDVRNAFNTWCRTRMWGPLLKNFPSLYRFVSLIYGSASSIVFFEPGAGLTEVVNSVGCKQGCSLGSFLFCLSIHRPLSKLQAEFKDLLIIAYCDDVHIVGDPATVIKAYRRWAYLYGAELQGEMRHDKGLAFSPTVPISTLQKFGLPYDMKVSTEGTRILGAPVGSVSFKVAFASKVVSSILDDLDALAYMPSLQAQHLIATKSLVHRLNHLLRNIPGGEIIFGQIAARYDEAIFAIPQRICHSAASLPLHARILTCLPLDRGGLGYRTWSSTCDAAFLASYSYISTSFKSLFPSLAPLYPSALTLSASTVAPSRRAAYAHRAFTRLRAQAPSISEILSDATQLNSLRKLQHSISTAATDAIAGRATETISKLDIPQHPRHMALYNSNCGDTFSFSAIPTDSDTTFCNQDFEVLTARRLLLRLTPTVGEKQQCPSCLKNSTVSTSGLRRPHFFPEVDDFGDHSIRCAKDGLRARLWHDPIARILTRIAKAANIICHYELAGFMSSSNSNKRPDVVFYIETTGQAHIVDVRTNDVTIHNWCKKSALTPGYANDQGMLLKNKKWQALSAAQNDHFLAFGIEVGGRLHPASDNFIRRLSFSAGGTASEQAAFRTWALQRLHCTSQRGVARIIRHRAPINMGPRQVDPRGYRNLGFLPPPPPLPPPPLLPPLPSPFPPPSPPRLGLLAQAGLFEQRQCSPVHIAPAPPFVL